MPTPPAYLGFLGFAQLVLPALTNCPNGVNGGTYGLRVTGSDLKLKQAVDSVPVIAGKYDQTVYKMGAYEVDGGLTFPGIMEDITLHNPVRDLWRLAMLRTNTMTDPVNNPSDGRLWPMDINLKYHTGNQAQFSYTNCILNSFDFSITQGDILTCVANVMGIQRNSVSTINEPQYVQRNTRAITWNDIYVQAYGSGGGSNLLIDGKYIRSFKITVNNNAERFYTLNGQLYPQDVAAKIRDITGSIVTMGRQANIGNDALNNQNRCYGDAQIWFGFNLTTGQCNASWNVRLPGVVYQIEDMSMGMDVIEATINFRALAGEVYQLNNYCESFDTY